MSESKRATRMKLLALVAVLITPATLAIAQQKARSHASREAAIELLCQKAFCVVRLASIPRRGAAIFGLSVCIIPEREITNWTVGAKAENYTYVCSH
jgi:hypothetical protein